MPLHSFTQVAVSPVLSAQLRELKLATASRRFTCMQQQKKKVVKAGDQAFFGNFSCRNLTTTARSSSRLFSPQTATSLSHRIQVSSDQCPAGHSPEKEVVEGERERERERERNKGRAGKLKTEKIKRRPLQTLHYPTSFKLVKSNHFLRSSYRK